MNYNLDRFQPSQLYILYFQCDKSFTATAESKVTLLVIAIFLKYNSGELLCRFGTH
jgi:hypothetical protein